MNAWINISAFDIESIGRNLDIFLRWKNADCYQIARLGVINKDWRIQVAETRTVY